ncbi:hypothetical protein [Bradyrhizobium arachidis]|uniref:hypothetical protein n=1 Tax=Bradyrhizobium arachidis TaxID=858423 RepID=UPI0021FA8C4E|nr:hypothetical protein KUF59_33040 [Bradyrhizobium arachidis]
MRGFLFSHDNAHFEFVPLFAGVLPPWLVPAPALPWLDGLALFDFMLAPVVVVDGDEVVDD